MQVSRIVPSLLAVLSLATPSPRWGGAAAQSGGRYRVQFFIQGQNLTNQSNYLGYSGTLSSPFFGRPTTVREMRKIDAGINLNF